MHCRCTAACCCTYSSSKQQCTAYLGLMQHQCTCLLLPTQQICQAAVCLRQLRRCVGQQGWVLVDKLCHLGSRQLQELLQVCQSVHKGLMLKAHQLQGRCDLQSSQATYDFMWTTNT
jgi:hypothetical protein